MVSPSEALSVDEVERGREDLVARDARPWRVRFSRRYLTWSVSYFIMPYIVPYRVRQRLCEELGRTGRRAQRESS